MSAMYTLHICQQYMNIKANEVCKYAKNVLAKCMQDYPIGIKLCTLHSIRSFYFADQWYAGIMYL
jgi:hypothetical protein